MLPRWHFPAILAILLGPAIPQLLGLIQNF
jgi:hypothetical protein